MENIENSIESLLEHAETYGKTNVDLLKLKSVDKTGDVLSTFFSHLLFSCILIFFIITFTVAFALWMGELIGKNYYGFLVVAAFYAFIGLIFFALRPKIKRHLKNSVIYHLLN